jgi:hypothetical protein
MRKKFMTLTAFRQMQMRQRIMAATKLAAEQYLNPDFLAGLKEPVALASGRTYAGGKFVPSGPDEIDDEDINDARE